MQWSDCPWLTTILQVGSATCVVLSSSNRCPSYRRNCSTQPALPNAAQFLPPFLIGTFHLAGKLKQRLQSLLFPLAFVIAVIAVIAGYAWLSPPQDLAPLKAPLMKELPEFDADYQRSMLWGSYRSGLYFGMRTRWVDCSCWIDTVRRLGVIATDGAQNHNLWRPRSAVAYLDFDQLRHCNRHEMFVCEVIASMLCTPHPSSASSSHCSAFLRLPKSLLNGLMWFDPGKTSNVNIRMMRHEASQSDKLSSYGWLRHDGVTFGRQRLIDRDHNISISMASCGGAVD